jgi:lipoate---protein ligase
MDEIVELYQYQNMNSFNILSLKNFPILKQLQLEEALLRTSNENWCLINHGSPPAIVMGISGKPEELIHLDKLNATRIPLIKRFSGGGTVVVDEKTLFVTLIVGQETLPGIKREPKAIMGWTETLYAPFFKDLPFQLIENDYALGEKKFGGNAQYIQKERWLHHSSFLWDYQKERMELLKLPQRRPNYRGKRPHSDFLTSLSKYFPCIEIFCESLLEHLKESLEGVYIDLNEVLPILEKPHRKGTKLIQPSFLGELS